MKVIETEMLPEFNGNVDLILTSTRSPLNHKKYGNEQGRPSEQSAHLRGGAKEIVLLVSDCSKRDFQVLQCGGRLSAHPVLHGRSAFLEGNSIDAGHGTTTTIEQLMEDGQVRWWDESKAG